MNEEKKNELENQPVDEAEKSIEEISETEDSLSNDLSVSPKKRKKKGLVIGIISTVIVAGTVIAVALTQGNGGNANNNQPNDQDCAHVYTAWTTTTEPTCKNSGLAERECSLCENKETKTLAKTDTHTEVTVSGKEATCKAAGLTDGKKCSVCGEVTKAQTEIPKKPHTYDDKYDEYCNVCNFKRDTVCVHTNTTTIPGKAATCTETGLTEGKRCTKCEDIIVEQTVIGAKGHTDGEWIIDTNATCTTTGSKHQVCSVCSNTIANEIVPAAPHTEVIDPAVDATCKSKGKTEGRHCSICNTVIIKQTDTAVIDHDYQDGACTMCKALDATAKQAEIDAENERHEAKLTQIEEYYPSVISGLQERINNLKDAYGITYVYSDSYCYDKISSLTTEIRNLERKIASLSGSTNSSDVVERRRYEVQLTQIQNEQNMYYKCITINGLSDEITNTRAYYSEAVSDENALHRANLEAIEIKYTCASNGHTVIIDEAILPTCTVDGRTEGSHCSVCHMVLTATQTITAKGHSYGNWNTVLNPTCENSGKEERTCSMCGNTEQNVLASLGHIGGAATCTEAAQCERCRLPYGLELGHIGGKASCTLQAVCTRCYQGYGNLLEHNGGTPTCTKKAICSSCSTEYGQVNSSNHVGTTTIRNNASPSCEENGYTGDVYCDDCNVMLVAGQNIPFTGHNWLSSYVYPLDAVGEYIHYSCTKCDTTYDSSVEAITAEVICVGGFTYGSLLRSITARIQGTGGYGDYNYSIKIYTDKTCTTQVKEYSGILIDAVTITVDAPNNRTSIAGWMMEVTLSDSYNHSQTTRWEFVAYKSGMSSSDLITQIQ